MIEHKKKKTSTVVVFRAARPFGFSSAPLVHRLLFLVGWRCVRCGSTLCVSVVGIPSHFCCCDASTGIGPEFLGRVRLGSSIASLGGVWIFQTFLKETKISSVLFWSTLLAVPLGFTQVSVAASRTQTRVFVCVVSTASVLQSTTLRTIAVQ